MLERKVMVEGEPLSRHELVQLTLVRGSHAVATVESWRDATLAEVNEEPKTTFWRLDFLDGMTFDEAEELVWDLPDFAEAVDASETLGEVLALLTDDQAERVPDAFPEWAAGVDYAVGVRVRHADSLWRCAQGHLSQDGWEPPEAPSLWARSSSGEVPKWELPTGSHDAYAEGDRVSHGGTVWRSLVDGNVWEPGSPGSEGLWAEDR